MLETVQFNPPLVCHSKDVLETRKQNRYSSVSVKDTMLICIAVCFRLMYAIQ